MIKKKYYKIRILSLNYKILNIFRFFIVKYLTKLKIKNFSIFFLPKKKRTLTLLKSPHVHKKAREQFHLIKYNLILKITFDLKTKFFIKQLILNKPHTIELNIFKY